MITIGNVSKAYGGKKLFEEVNVAFAPENRYGLTGPNGAGKSTLMRIFAGRVEPDDGHVSLPRKTSFLEQDHNLFDDRTVMDTVLMGNPRLFAVLEERNAIYESGDESDEVGMRLAELEMVVAEEDGYTADSEAEELLNGLGVADAHFETLMGEMSAAMKVRVMLAQALFGNPDAMLLDEPTNHLDLDTIEWLETNLRRYRGILITISHDRRFLNNICTHTADIDYETIIIYPGNYDDMIRIKAQSRGRIESQHSAKQARISELNDFIQRFTAGSRASQVQSRKKLVEKLDPGTLKRSNVARPYVRFDVVEQSGKHVIEIDGLEMGFGDNSLFRDFHAHVARGEHIGIIGKDGMGKTTLVRLLMEQLQPRAGKLIWGHATKIGFLPQEHEDAIEHGLTIDTWLHGFKPGADLEDVRGLLGRMLFRGEEGKKQTATLSGGERVRMLLCKLMITSPNAIVLDEPTNHLDLEAISALAEGLAKYEGTTFVATHDRTVLTESCDRIWRLKEGELLDFRGPYEEFVERYGHS